MKYQYYFDLNIPYVNSAEQRAKLVLMALELGYSAVAHTKTIKGVMSDRDICKISPVPLSLLNLTPPFYSSVSFHRQLLGVPLASPFRQYTRLSVCCDTIQQAQALNDGNPVLKTYDLVAAKPLTLDAFTYVCEHAEVDIISVTEKLPFEVKRPSVQAAIKRGVYFEITYSGLFADCESRKQIVPKAQKLIMLTGGKNIIFSSAAVSVNGLRGPLSVANIAFEQIRLSMERTRDAISKNCRILITNALRKKKYYKEAIRAELVSPADQSGSLDSCFDDWRKWDPISSGDGDLLLDDMEKLFAASGKVSKTVKAVDFAKVVDSLPSHGFKAGDVISGTGCVHESLKGKIYSSVVQAVEASATPENLSEQPDGGDHLPEPNKTSFCNISSACQTSDCQTAPKVSPEGNSSEVLPMVPESEPCTSHAEPCKIHVEEDANIPDEMDVQYTISETDQHDRRQKLFRTSELKTVSIDDEKQVPSSESNFFILDGTRDCEAATSVNVDVEPQLASPSKGSENPVPDIINLVPGKTHPESELKNSNDIDACFTMAKKQVHDSLLKNDKMEIVSLEIEELRRHREDAALVDEVLCAANSDLTKGKQNLSVADSEQPEEVTMGEQWVDEDDSSIGSPNLVQAISVKCKRKLRVPYQGFMFPLKRMLIPTPSMKKTKRLRSKFRTLKS